ncbi:hypothetical protein [Corynebacterium hindlerae]|uniref:hypothetical protein n=1 Tax=Corynebacterium hindlerae TaxID=699041 RepID=UPI003AAFF49C
MKADFMPRLHLSLVTFLLDNTSWFHDVMDNLREKQWRVWVAFCARLAWIDSATSTLSPIDRDVQIRVARRLYWAEMGKAMGIDFSHVGRVPVNPEEFDPVTGKKRQTSANRKKKKRRKRRNASGPLNGRRVVMRTGKLAP